MKSKIVNGDIATATAAACARQKSPTLGDKNNCAIHPHHLKDEGVRQPRLHFLH
jgi:hypothetical protein